MNTPCNILAVDREVGILNALERTFRREYNFFSATNGEDALAIMRKNNIALIIADHRMKGMNGFEFLKKASLDYPNTIRIVLTAYMDKKLLMESMRRNHIHRYVLKPWEPENIRGLVRESVQNYYEKAQ